jgi:hypothetical protein
VLARTNSNGEYRPPRCARECAALRMRVGASVNRTGCAEPNESTLQPLPIGSRCSLTGCVGGPFLCSVTGLNPLSATSPQRLLRYMPQAEPQRTDSGSTWRRRAAGLAPPSRVEERSSVPPPPSPPLPTELQREGARFQTARTAAGAAVLWPSPGLPSPFLAKAPQLQASPEQDGTRRSQIVAAMEQQPRIKKSDDKRAPPCAAVAREPIPPRTRQPTVTPRGGWPRNARQSATAPVFGYPLLSHLQTHRRTRPPMAKPKSHCRKTAPQRPPPQGLGGTSPRRSGCGFQRRPDLR